MREKHGDDDQQRPLPNNRSKPVGRGISVWLQEEREAHWLGLVAQVEQAHIPSEGRYPWLLAQLKTLPDVEAAQLITDYEERKKAEERKTIGYAIRSFRKCVPLRQ